MASFNDQASSFRIYVASHNLIYAASSGDIVTVRSLLVDPYVDPSCQCQGAIRIASCDGHLDIVECLLADPRVDPSARDNYALRMAACNGHLAIVKRLLEDPRVDPSDLNCDALCCAARNDHFDIVKLLWDDYYCLNMYCLNMFKNDICTAVSWAANAGNSHIVDWFLTDPRVSSIYTGIGTIEKACVAMRRTQVFKQELLERAFMMT